MAESDAVITVRIKVGLRLWDAFKLRLAGPEVRKAVIDKVQVLVDKAVPR